jgi:Fur family ferric uptake transcriptional regulator
MSTHATQAVDTADAASAWVERAELALAAAGRKRGGARRALLELLDGQQCALTALEIEQALAAHGTGRPSANMAPNAGSDCAPPTGRRVSRASVYRILDELEGLGLVQRVETGQAMVRYERASAHDDHHHHLVCDRCGLVMPFSDPDLERAIMSLSERVPLAVSEHEIVLHGACEECAQ